MQGKGTFVAHPKISTRSPAYKGIREQLEGMGYAVATKVLADKVVPADEPVARALQIPVGERVHEIRRVRLIADDEPISLHTSYVPERLAPVLAVDDLVDRQLCVVLEEDHGLRMSKISEGLESTLPNAQEAKALKIRRTTPLLLLTHEIADPTGRLFEFSRILFRGDKLRLQFHYDLDAGNRPSAGSRGSVRLVQHSRQRGDVDDALVVADVEAGAHAAPEHPARPGRSPRRWQPGTGRRR